LKKKANNCLILNEVLKTKTSKLMAFQQIERRLYLINIHCSWDLYHSNWNNI